MTETPNASEAVLEPIELEFPVDEAPIGKVLERRPDEELILKGRPSGWVYETE